MKHAALQLDFKRPARSRWRWAGWALLGLACAVAAGLADRHVQLERDRAAMHVRHDQLAQPLRARTARSAVTALDPRTQARVERANLVIDQLTVPWDSLFHAVEQADARGLGLLALTPVARDRTVRIAGEARSVTALLAYVDSLAAQPALGQVHLLGYSAAVRDGGPIVAFTIAAQWKAAP